MANVVKNGVLYKPQDFKTFMQLWCLTQITTTSNLGGEIQEMSSNAKEICDLQWDMPG